MANQGAKKRRDENSRHMKKLFRLIISCNVIYLVVRAGIFHSTFKWKHWVGFILTFFSYAVPYQQLAVMAKPTYADDGELLDGGFDMSSDGICGYLHDVIYVTAFVQITTIISEKFVYVYLLIPAFVGIKLFGFIKGFFPHGSQPVEEDEKTRKKREKMERKASRPKLMRTRNK
ncbi:uncharacterized protein LOC127793990 [Diospyros lotus]|uniref:uncharacterized protein LOC127793990 n=1 Tax=Diospyros lotus TaxID=55363 RepID=UPI00225ABF18|nr:uncharacterized protein LOC127793990 [Diospyros lotus]